MRELLRSPLARLWVPVLTLAAGVAYVDRGTDPGDLVYFVHRGEHLLSSGWASTFADPTLQSGPLQLVVFGAVRNLTALAFVIELSVAALVLYVAGRIGASDCIRLVVGLLAVGAGLTHIAFVDLLNLADERSGGLLREVVEATGDELARLLEEHLAHA